MELYKYNTSTPIASIDGSVNPGNAFTFSALDSGRYYVKAVAKTALVCDAYSEVINVDFVAIYPTLALDSIPNINCVAVAPSGQVTAFATGPAVLNYEFFSGNNNTTPADLLQASTSNILANRQGGYYTTRVTAGNGCTNTLSIYVPADTALVIADVGAMPRTLCDVNPGDGNNGQVSIISVTEITNISSSTGPFNPATYSVTWPIADSNPGTPGILESLDSGNYTLQIANVITGCTTPLITARVEDLRENPIVNLTGFVNPTRCLKPTNITGELHVQAVGTSATGFTYNWYNGGTATPPIIPPLNTPDFTGITIPSGQGTVTYTIEVINNDNNCKVFDTYTLQQDTAVMTLIGSSAPLTYCSSPDGGAYAIITSADETLYTYEWYAGTVAVPPVASPPPTLPVGRFLTNQPDGLYLVVAIDLADPSCFMTDTLEVEDLRVYPVVTATALNPMTNCDDSRPNGSVFASVGGNIIDYQFDWFGETLPAPDTIATGSMVNDLPDSTYTVIASHIVTGCSDTTQTTINFVPANPHIPTIEIIQNVTSCVEDNGILAVSVDGDVANYIFEWYDGPAEKPVADFIGDYYDSLGVDRNTGRAQYTVKATSRITGCSALATAELIYAPVIPEFTIEILPATCDSEDGQIYLTITNDIEIDTIIWETDNGVILGDPVLQGVPAGHYTVTVVSQLGCEASQEVDLKNEIHPFNGVSRNGDGRNDYFHINCIDSFPDNIVKIFNRAGTLVYENRGYNNIDIYFDGQSNKGISMMGTNLPDGTYFYVIDKRDGSKPIAGYLEIVN
jgi:gliding motility-associated-like protein